MAPAVAIALIAGIGIGVVVATLVSRRRQPVDTGTDEVPGDDGVADLLSSAFDQLEIGVIVANTANRVVYRNEAAQTFQGTHVGVLLDDHVSAVIDEAQTGRSVARTVELHGPPKTWLALSADPMPGGEAVVTIQDVSERMRTDAVRTDFVTNISHELKTPVGAVAVLAEALVDESDTDVVHRCLLYTSDAADDSVLV